MTYRTSIKLGARYRDQVSGWDGIAEAVYFYRNGCVRVSLAHHDKDGQPQAFVFDEQEVDYIDEGVSLFAPVTAPTGGPRDRTPVPR